MNISNQTKILLLFVAVLIFILFLNSYCRQEPMQNEGKLVYEKTNDIIIDDGSNELKFLEEDIDVVNPRTGETKNVDFTFDIHDRTASGCPDKLSCEEKNFRNKLKSKNRSKDGKYKKSSYAEGIRGNGPSEFDEFFDKNNEMVRDVYAGDDTFVPNDETGGQLATYQSNGKKIKMTDEEMFNASNLLPKDTNADWFDVMPEAVSVKNKHLINISRPIGINTIGTTNKNPSYDLRGTIPNPKFIASPWLQSSIEPDINNRGLC